MQREWNDRIIFNASQREWWSKLTDGLLAASILFLTWLIVLLAIRPISNAFGLPGLLIYVLGLLAIAMYSLQQSLVYRQPETLRAWNGIAGGTLAWAVVLVSAYIGIPFAAGAASLIMLMMVSLIVFILWKSALPLGARFFSLTFLLHWAGYLFMGTQQWLSPLSPIFALAYRVTGYLAIAGALLTVGWIIFKSRRRIQRVSGALTIWFLVNLALYIFHSQFFSQVFVP